MNIEKVNISEVKLMQGDNMESLKKLPDNSVDSVVSDPPYGLSFMGKKWDYDVPSVEFWKEVYRVLKPGGHVLSFGGTRTYHRMAVNIEDAGFEIRDQIMWLYGSGFPKSLNIGKDIEKINVGGLDNLKVVGVKKGIVATNHTKFGVLSLQTTGDIPIYEINNEWEGWGTALKPAQEIVAVAQKPEDIEGTALNLIYIIKNEIWKLYVRIVEQSSELSQAEQKEVLNTAQCLVEKNTNIQDALQGLMDMSQLKLMENMNWSTVLLWHNILEDLSQKMSRYTTSTKSNLITDLKTLKSLEWQNILENIIQVKNNQIDGLNVNALTAVALFNVLNLKLKDIQQHSVQDNVIYKEEEMDCQNNPICVARKPLSEKSVAENVLKWKTGGINVDGCRIGNDTITTNGYGDKGFVAQDGYKPTTHEGRFPANIILECICDEVIKGEKGQVRIGRVGKDCDNGIYEGAGWKKDIEGKWFNDKGDIHTNPMCPCRLMDEQSGGASRFFYQAKVSKKERNMGLDGFEENEVIRQGLAGENNNPVHKNTHPTLKPINLMTYLCRLVTPPNGIVLDPFMGSGSTGIAAQLEGFRFVGMELDPEYFKIAEARIENWEKYKEFVKK